MNTRVGSVVHRWATWIVPSILFIVIILVPCLIVENCVSARPSVSRVTAYYDPSWNTRTRNGRTTASTSTSALPPVERQKQRERQRRRQERVNPLPLPTQPLFLAESETQNQAQIQATTPIPLQLETQDSNSNENQNHNQNSQLSNYTNYNVNNTYFPLFPLPPAPSYRHSHRNYQQEPQQFIFPFSIPPQPIIPIIPWEAQSQSQSQSSHAIGEGEVEVENMSKQLPPNNKIKRRKRLRNIIKNNQTKTNENNPNTNTLTRRQSLNYEIPPPGQFLGPFNVDLADPNPRRRNRRRRLTRRKKIKNKYFHPQSIPNSEIDPENLVNSASIEPFDNNYGYPLFNPESLDNSKFRGVSSPLLEPIEIFGNPVPVINIPESNSKPGQGQIQGHHSGRFHPSRNAAAEFWTVLTEAPDINIKSINEPSTKTTAMSMSKVTTPAPEIAPASAAPASTSTQFQSQSETTTKKQRLNSNNNNVVIFQRGTPSYPTRTTQVPNSNHNYNPNHNYHFNPNLNQNNDLNIANANANANHNHNNPRNPNQNSHQRRRKIHRVKPSQIQIQNQNQNQNQNLNFNDPNDLVDLHVGESINPFLNSSTPISNDLRHSIFSHGHDLLNPLSLFNSDTSLRDSVKIPENKTIGIKHMLSDSPVGVKIAPDLHMDLKNPHSLLNHDSIISSDYERQVYKSKPRISVKHSVSVSTSTTVSSPSPTKSPNVNSKNSNNKKQQNVQIQSHGDRHHQENANINGNVNVNVKPKEIEITSTSTSTTTKRTTPLSSSSFSSTEDPTSTTARNDQTRFSYFNDDHESSKSASKSWSSTTPKPMITLEDMFTLFPNVAEESEKRETGNTNFPFKTPSSSSTKPDDFSGNNGASTSSTATTYKPSFPTIIFAAGSTTTRTTSKPELTTPTTTITRSPLPLTTFAQNQMRGKAKIEEIQLPTTTTASPNPIYNPVTSIKIQGQSQGQSNQNNHQGKTPFTLRPKQPSSPSPSSSSSSRPHHSSRTPGSSRRTSTSTTVTPTTLTLTFPTVAPVQDNEQKINTFLDNIDESAGKNTWTPFQIFEATTKPATMTTVKIASNSNPSSNSDLAAAKSQTSSIPTGHTIPTTKRPTTEKIKINKDPPLILMPPFTNDKEEPRPVTYTTPEPVTSISSQNLLNPSADELLLKQLLGELGFSGDDLDILNSTPKPPPSTTVKKHVPVYQGPGVNADPPNFTETTRDSTSSRPTTTTTTTTKSTPKTTTTTTTTTRKPTLKVTSTQPPQPTQAELFNLFNLFAPQTQAPNKGQSEGQLQGQRPTPAAALNPTTANDFLNLLNLFQPSTPAPAKVKPTAAQQNDLFNLFNLFQPQTTTTPRPAPPPAQAAGGINDLFNIFNLFTTPPPLHKPQAPQTVRPPTQTPAPAANDILGLLNLLQPQSSNQNQQQHQNQHNHNHNHQQNQAPNPQGDLEALVQQALLESLGLKGAGGGGGGGGLGGLGGLGNLFSPQATNLNHQLINPSNSPDALIGKGAGTGSTKTTSSENGLSDSDLKSIFAILDQQDSKNGTKGSNPGSGNTNNNGTKEGPTVVFSTKVTSTTTTTTTTPAPKTQGSSQKTTTLMPIFRNMLNLFGITDPTSLHTTLGTLPPAMNASLHSILNANANSNAKSNSSNPSETDLLLQFINANSKPQSTKAPTTVPAPVPSSTSSAVPSLDLLSQLLSLGQVVENTKAKAKPAPVKNLKETVPQQQPQLVLQQQQTRQPALDIQSILAQSWLANSATTQKPEVVPSESNLFQILANQFTPRPARPNGLYYWVDLNAFMGEQGGNPLGGIRPKLGHKDYFLKVKRETSPHDKTKGTLSHLNTLHT